MPAHLSPFLSASGAGRRWLRWTDIKPSGHSVSSNGQARAIYAARHPSGSHPALLKCDTYLSMGQDWHLLRRALVFTWHTNDTIRADSEQNSHPL